MSSGTLLLAVEPSSRKAVLKALTGIHTRLTEIGRLTARAKGRVLVRGGKRLSLKSISQDELYKLA